MSGQSDQSFQFCSLFGRLRITPTQLRSHLAQARLQYSRQPRQIEVQGPNSSHKKIGSGHDHFLFKAILKLCFGQTNFMIIVPALIEMREDLLALLSEITDQDIRMMLQMM